MAEQGTAPTAKTTTKSMDKWKKKKWYTVLSPLSFDQKALGETPAAKPNLVENRTMTVNLDMLTGDRKQRHISITFKVNKIQGSNAQTVTVGHEIKMGYIGRMIRRRKSKVTATCLTQTKDNKQIMVTALCLCGNKVPNKNETAIRKLMEEEIIHAARRKDSEQFIQELIFGSIAAKIFKRAKNHAIIKRIEITKSRTLSDRNAKSEFVIEDAPAAPAAPAVGKQGSAEGEEESNAGTTAE